MLGVPRSSVLCDRATAHVRGQWSIHYHHCNHLAGTNWDRRALELYGPIFQRIQTHFERAMQ